MDKNIAFQIDDITNNVENENEEMALAEIKFLSSSRNSHRIHITKEILQRDASSLLGKFLVGKMNCCDMDVMGHEADEIIFGYFPQNQKVRFEQKHDGEIVAIASAVISKIYAPSFYNIFKSNNNRNVSVEMAVFNERENYQTGLYDIDGFNIMGVTVLGLSIKGSCPDANMSIIRFTENETKRECEDYYKSVQRKLAEETDLDEFVKNKKAKMEGKTYKVNEQELKETPWGDVDKGEIRDAVMQASNRNGLVKKVYLKVQDGWEDAPSENLKYPVMELDDGTFYYNRFALASALAYARQHEETDVISKIIKLYKKFDLVEEGEEENMSKKKFEDENAEALEQEELECAEEEMQDEELGCGGEEAEMADEPKEEEVEEPVDEPSDDKDEMSDDEEGEEDESEEAEEEPEKEDDEADEEMSKDEKIKELEDIIMAQDAELEELRAYKEEKEGEERDFAVQQTLEEVRECVDAETFEALKEEGMACKLADVDGWKNKAKSLAFDANSQKNEAKLSMWSMSISRQDIKKPAGLWD